jgi:hypothetical protein
MMGEQGLTMGPSTVSCIWLMRLSISLKSVFLDCESFGLSVCYELLGKSRSNHNSDFLFDLNQHDGISHREDRGWTTVSLVK